MNALRLPRKVQVTSQESGCARFGRMHSHERDGGRLWHATGHFWCCPVIPGGSPTRVGGDDAREVHVEIEVLSLRKLRAGWHGKQDFAGTSRCLNPTGYRW